MMASRHHYLIIFANGHGPRIVLLPQLFAERRTHENTPDATRRREMALSVLSPRGGNKPTELHDLWGRGRARVVYGIILTLTEKVLIANNELEPTPAHGRCPS